MSDLSDCLLLVLGFLGYGTAGTLTSFGVYRGVVRRKGALNIDGDDQVGCFLAGALWPVGVWILIYGLLIAKTASGSARLTREQREREKRLLRQREDLRLDIMQEENNKAINEFHKRIMREIQRGD